MGQHFEPFSEEKVWGRVQHIFVSPHAAVSCLEVRAGYRCSRHLHSQRANLFAVLEGQIVVEIWPNGRSELIELGPGDTCTVPSGVPHRFRVLQSGRVVEVYWPDRGGEVSMADIHRFDVGGEDDLAGLKGRLHARNR